MKPFGCEICDDMFQVEKEFAVIMEHCFEEFYFLVVNDFVELLKSQSDWIALNFKI